MYTFNFNLGGGQNTPANHDFEPIVTAIKHLVEDWHSFYNLYKKFAPPPVENQIQIQEWFNEIRDKLDELIELYNAIPNSPELADIRTDNDAEELLKHFAELNNLFSMPKKDTDELMYN